LPTVITYIIMFIDLLKYKPGTFFPIKGDHLLSHQNKQSYIQNVCTLWQLQIHVFSKSNAIHLFSYQYYKSNYQCCSS